MFTSRSQTAASTTFTMSATTSSKVAVSLPTRTLFPSRHSGLRGATDPRLSLGKLTLSFPAQDGDPHRRPAEPPVPPDGTEHDRRVPVARHWEPAWRQLVPALLVSRTALCGDLFAEVGDSGMRADTLLRVLAVGAGSGHGGELDIPRSARRMVAKTNASFFLGSFSVQDK